jgi:hypothetical protein
LILLAEFFGGVMAMKFFEKIKGIAWPKNRFSIFSERFALGIVFMIELKHGTARKALWLKKQ